MQPSSMALPRDETTKSLHDYFTNNYYKHLITLSLILMFAIVFYLIYLIIDSLIDKSYHQFISVQAYERYEARKLQSLKRKSLKDDAQSRPEEEPDDGDAETRAKRKALERSRKIEFTSWSHRNLHVSFIHSVLCSVWLVRIVACRSSDLFGDLLGFVSWDTYLLLAFSCGYFLYDFYDIYANGYLKIEWVVCVHHAIVLLTFGYHMINLVNIGYTVVALFMEFNSVFLHARKLLRFYGFKRESALVRVNNILNLLTFVVFRFGVLGIICAGIYVDGKRVTLRYLIMLSTCSFLMGIINVVLFKRILAKDWLTSRKKSEETTCANGGRHCVVEQVNLLEAKIEPNLIICDGDDLTASLKQSSDLILNMKNSMHIQDNVRAPNGQASFDLVNKKHD